MGNRKNRDVHRKSETKMDRERKRERETKPRCRESANCRRERDRVVIFYVDICMREGQCCFCSCSVGPFPVPPRVLTAADWLAGWTARVNYNAGTWDDSEMCHTLASWVHESDPRFDVRCVGPEAPRTAPFHCPTFVIRFGSFFILFFYLLMPVLLSQQNVSVMRGVAILIAST